MKVVLIILTALLSFQVHVQAQPKVPGNLPPVSTAESVDLRRYLGKWYEIAAIPQSFEKKCVGDTAAEYTTADDGLISVVNSCRTSNGQTSLAEGRVKIVDQISNSKLKVTFVHFLGWQFLLGGDYWILAIGENYSYAVVGAPGRDYAWILSRTPEMTEVQMREANRALVKQSFDSCKLISTIQSLGLKDKTPFCQLVVGE